MAEDENLSQKIQREAAVNLEAGCKDILAKLESLWPEFKLSRSDWEGDLRKIKHYAELCRPKELIEEFRIRGRYSVGMSRRANDALAEKEMTPEVHSDVVSEMANLEDMLAGLAANILSSECSCRLRGF